MNLKFITDEINNAGLSDYQCKIAFLFVVEWLGNVEREVNNDDIELLLKLALKKATDSK